MLADYAASINEGVVYVLADGPAVAGALAINPVGDAVLLENVAVHPSYQGMGPGRESVRYVEEFARESGLYKINLYTNELMRENVAFYKRLDFRETDRRLDDGYRRVFMSKELPEGAWTSVWQPTPELSRRGAVGSARASSGWRQRNGILEDFYDDRGDTPWKEPRKQGWGP